MKYTQIRSAAGIIEYAGKRFLVDPWLAERGACGVYGKGPILGAALCGRVEQDLIAMPRVELPMPLEQILSGIDAHIVTHTHPDHIDMADDGTVGAPLNKEIPAFVQNGADAQIFKNSGFHDIRILNEATVFDGIELIKTPGRHGTVAPAGDVCGVVFRAPQEPTVYLAGDTIYYEGVKNTIDTYYPDVIIVNACDAVSLGTGRLIMDDEDVYWTHMTAPSATIICVHMDTIAHFNQTRAELKHLLSGFNILNSVRIPNDGETLTFERQ